MGAFSLAIANIEGFVVVGSPTEPFPLPPRVLCPVEGLALEARERSAGELSFSRIGVRQLRKQG
jgi:hypothetical protein